MLGYVKVATFLKGFRNIEIEETAPSVNGIAMSAVDDKTFYLNANL